MRCFSECFAVTDFVRLGMRNDPSNVAQWEWPIWVGIISIQSMVNVKAEWLSANVQIMSTVQLNDDAIPFDFSFVSKEGKTGKGMFRIEPKNVTPSPPWGRIKGITDTDNTALQEIAARLEAGEGSQIAVPECWRRRQNYDSDCKEDNFLEVQIFSKNDAQRRLNAAARTSCKPFTMDWILNKYGASSDYSLICCWDKSKYKVLRKHNLALMMQVMKAIGKKF